MQAIGNYTQENKAALFDWLVFGISLSLSFIFPSLRDFVVSPGFSFWMLAAMLLYTAGAALKHLPLRYRLSSTGKSVKEMPLLIFLLAGHLCIFIVVFIFSESAIQRIFTAGAVTGKNTTSGTDTLLTILIACFITWLVFRPKRVVREKVSLPAKGLFRMELVADIFLVAAVSIFSFAFWEKGIFALLTAKPVESIGDVVFTFIFLCIAYILFYLPLRYLFLIEDYRHGGTWKRLLLIFGLLLIKSLFEMLHI